MINKIFTLLILSLMSVSAFSGGYVGLHNIQPDVTFNEVVSANGKTYGTQVFNDDSNPIGLEAGYIHNTGSFKLYGGVSVQSLKYKTPRGTQAANDTATNNTAISQQTAIITAEEAKTSPDQTIIDAAQAVIDTKNVENQAIEDAHRRSETVKSVMLGANKAFYRSGSGWEYFAGGRAYVSVDGSEYADKEVFLAEIGVGRENISFSGLVNGDGAFLSTAFLF